jgi:hypothetical protein
MMDVMQLLQQVYHAFCCGFFLVWGAPTSRLQDRCKSLPDTMLFGFTLVISWFDALYVSRKKVSFSSQSLCGVSKVRLWMKMSDACLADSRAL